MTSIRTKPIARTAPRAVLARTLLTTALALVTAAAPQAWAAGGAGGAGRNGVDAGGSGGTGDNGGSGGDAAPVNNEAGGGGGGAAGGGTGGRATYNGGYGAPGGTGGTANSRDGGAGQHSNSYGGGGGGGGFNGNGAGSSVLTNTTSLAGGNGGQGGAGGVNDSRGGGGGGGAGGYGAVVTGAGVSSNTSTLSGGTGGAGGAGGTGLINAPPIDAGTGGNGGDGGIGILFQGPAATFNNTGAVTGGNGGVGGIGGFANGTGGIGGVGIQGAALTINNTGSISGGLANNGSGPQAFAIVLTGGVNSVGGTGAINGGINVLGGSFAPALPDSAVGMPLIVTGPLVFASTSAYQIRITPTANDSTVVFGTATLSGAAVNVVAGEGTYKTGKRTILTATNVSGTFGALTTNLAFLKPTLSYDASNVFLTIAGNGAIIDPVTGTVSTDSIDYRTAAVTRNQVAIATGLTVAGAFGPSGNGGKIIDGLNQLTAPQARAVFDSLTGEGLTAAQNTANRSSALFNSALFDQTTFYGPGNSANSITLTAPPLRELADLPSRAHAYDAPIALPRTWRAWASGFGASETVRGNATIGSATQDNTLYGGAIGVDYQLTPNYLVGIAVGGSDGSFSVPVVGTSGSTTGGHVALYDLLALGQLYGASSISGSFFDNRTTRSIGAFGGLSAETERATFASHEFRGRIEIGRHFGDTEGSITPFVALEGADLRANGFTESAVSGPGFLRLTVNSQAATSLPSFVGARFQRVIPLGGGVTFVPTVEIAYVHEFEPQQGSLGTLANLPGSTFLVNGAQPGINSAAVKAGGELALNPNSILFANFDGQFSGVSQSYAGKGGFKYLW